MPVGSRTPVRVDLRVVSASHRDLAVLVAEGRFREDLFYRLNAATLRLPPLRRRQDIGWLLDRLLQRAGVAADSEARRCLLAHGWPGNVRELVNAIELGSALASGGMIRRSDLPEDLLRPPILDRSDQPQPETGSAEADELRRLLVQTGWNVSEAARRLGCDRTTVHRRMRRLNMTQPH